MRIKRIGLACFTAVMLVAMPALAERATLQLLAEKTQHPAALKSGQDAPLEQQISAYYTKHAEGFDAEGPIEGAWVWYLARWTRPTEEDPSVSRISTKYHNIGVANYNACAALEKVLIDAGHEKRYADAWMRELSDKLIRWRMPLSVEAWKKRLGRLPRGEVVEIEAGTDVMQLLAERYSAFAGLDAAQRGPWLAALSSVNPDLPSEGFYLVKQGEKVKEAWPHAVAELPNGWKRVTLYGLRPDGVLLLPDERWLRAQLDKHADTATPEPDASADGITVYRLTFDEAGANGEDWVLTVTARDGVVDNAYLTRPSLNNRQWPVIPLIRPRMKTGGDATWLSLDGGALHGAAGIIPGGYPSAKKPENMFFALDTKTDGNGLTGTYKFWRFDERGRLKQERGGSVTGGPWRPEPMEALPDGKSWAQFMGPTGTGESVSRGEPWVSDFEDAKLAWSSDLTIPTGRGPDTRGGARATPAGIPLMGGWASPVVADNKVVLFYYEPSGDTLSYGANPNEMTHGQRLFRRNAISADDVVHCFDARTGRTLWKRVYKDEGINWAGFNKGGPMLSPAIHGGRVFAITTTGNVVCLDLDTGRTLWRNDIGRRHELIEAEKPGLLASGDNFSTRNDFQINVVVVQGVVVVGDGRRTKRDYRYEQANGLIGFDARTGKRLWHLPEVVGNNKNLQSAQHIDIDGKAFLLGSSDDGVHLIDPIQGVVIDTAEDLRLRHTNLAVGNGIVVGDRVQPRELQTPSSVLAYRVNQDGFTEAWELPKPYGRMQGGGTYQNGRLYLQLHSPKKMVICVDAKTGDILSEAPVMLAGGEHCPFIIGGDGKLIACTDRTNGLLLFDAEPDRLSPTVTNFRIELATGYCGSIIPAVVDGRMFIRQPNRLVCYDVRASQSPKRAHGEHWTRYPAPRPQAPKPKPKANPNPNRNPRRSRPNPRKPKNPSPNPSRSSRRSTHSRHKTTRRLRWT